MRYSTVVCWFAVVVVGAAAPAAAQRFPFEHPFDAAGIATVDISTMRGKIDVTVGEPGRILVKGAASVRAGLDVPLDAVDIARRIAAAPPIQREGSTLRLRPPVELNDQRAVTLNYQVEVPPGVAVRSDSDSGATTIHGVSGAVHVRTQSAAIQLTRLGASAVVNTGSGSVRVDGVDAGLDVTTSSSAINARALRGPFRARTQSGNVDAVFAGDGSADVETGSSAMRLRNVRGGVRTLTETGRVVVQGAPVAPWDVMTGSSSVELTLASTAFNVDASNRSGTIRVDGAPVAGLVSKRQVAGVIGAGGPLVRVVTRSGSIEIAVAPPVISPPQ